MQRVSLAICTPHPFVNGPNGPRLERITAEWHRARMSLAMPTNFTYVSFPVDGQEVGDARNIAAEFCLKHEPRPEFLFFLDYDVIPQFDALTKLIYRARCFPEKDIFAGVYCCKSSPPEPLLYRRLGEGPFWDWAVGDLVYDVQYLHMGLTLIRTKLFEELEHTAEKPWFRTDSSMKLEAGGLMQHRGTEDIWFCNRVVEELGGDRVVIDTSVLAGHIAHDSGIIYGLPADCPPVKRAKWLADNQGKSDADKDQFDTQGYYARGEADGRHEKPLKAIDLGSGGRRRHWEGYETTTTDIRPAEGVDQVMDTRLINLPNESFDLVASSHHLEHLGRWEQEQVWAEMFRILKPGGRMEHIVPNLEWAAKHVADGILNEHVYNVLYGAQEQHGYARDFNTHYFGYTPEVGVALAEGCGLVNVSVRGYLDDEELGYNLVITGEKPGVEVAEEGGGVAEEVNESEVVEAEIGDSSELATIAELT